MGKCQIRVARETACGTPTATRCAKCQKLICANHRASLNGSWYCTGPVGCRRQKSQKS